MGGGAGRATCCLAEKEATPEFFSGYLRDQILSICILVARSASALAAKPQRWCARNGNGALILCQQLAEICRSPIAVFQVFEERLKVLITAITPRRGLREGNGGHVLATEPGAEISQPDTRNTLALALPRCSLHRGTRANSHRDQ